MAASKSCSNDDEGGFNRDDDDGVSVDVVAAAVRCRAADKDDAGNAGPADQLRTGFVSWPTTPPLPPAASRWVVVANKAWSI